MKEKLKNYTVFIRSNDFMKDQYICKSFFNNKNMNKYIKENYPEYHIVWVRID